MTRSLGYKYLPLGFILLVSAVLRLRNFTQGYGFYIDQGQDLLAIRNWFISGKVPLQGIETSIGGFHMGPLYYYLIAPFVYLTSGDPIGPVLFFLIVGLTIVVLSYVWALRFANVYTAIIFSSAIATSPHLIFLSKGAYSPNLQPFILLFLLWFLFSYLRNHRTKDLIFTYLLIGIGVQFHYVFLANLLTVSLLILLTDRKSLSWQKVTLASLAFISPLLAFLLGQLQNNLLDLKNIYHYTFKTASSISTYRLGLLDTFGYPFSIYFSYEMIEWPWRIFLSSITLLVVFLNVLIAFRNNSYLTKLILSFYLLSFIWAVVMNLKLDWWYFEYFSLLSLFLIANVISYIYQVNPKKYLWFLLLLVVFWRQIFMLPDAYKVDRPVSIVKETSERIIQGTDRTKPISIFVLTNASSNLGYEYRYFLEQSGFTTSSAKTIEEADYTILEKRDGAIIFNKDRSKILDIGLKVM